MKIKIEVDSQIITVPENYSNRVVNLLFSELKSTMDMDTKLLNGRIDHLKERKEEVMELKKVYLKNLKITNQFLSEIDNEIDSFNLGGSVISIKDVDSVRLYLEEALKQNKDFVKSADLASVVNIKNVSGRAYSKITTIIAKFFPDWKKAYYSGARGYRFCKN
jgi:hypothetical protein